MDGDAWITVAVLAVMGIALVRDWVSPAAGVVGATIVLFTLEIITPAQAFAGFSNPAPLTIGLLYVAARAVEKTNALTPVLRGLLRSGSGLRVTLARLLLPAGSASGFFSNTPIVAMLIDPVVRWSEEEDVAASRILIPISYAAILGGGVTLIGTSTNLLVSGLLVEAGQDPLGMFELAPIGLPAAVAGLTIILVLAPVLLPVRSRPGHSERGGVREYLVRFVVEDRNPARARRALVGRPLADTRIAEMGDATLIGIDRGGERLEVADDVVLQAGDGLSFRASADAIVTIKAHEGLAGDQRHLLLGDQARMSFFEAVISASSPLVGRTLRDSDFRNNLGGVVVAIHRSGDELSDRLDEVVLRHGDSLLLIADDGFRRRWRDRGLFLLIARVDLGLPPALDPAVADSDVAAAEQQAAQEARQGPRFGMPPADLPNAWIAGLVMLAIVALPVVTGGSFSVLRSASLGAIALVATRVLSTTEAREAVDIGVIVMIAAAFGLGAAVESTGLAEQLADGVIGAFGPLGDIGLVVGLVVATSLLTELVTNSAAIVLLFPIVQSVAMQEGLDGRTLAIAVGVAASSSFLTPIGYQTNTMVYGPGGYRFTDYLRLGLPVMTAVLAAIVTAALLLA